MKGLILAAGRGTRLKPLTDRRSKPLIPLAGQPLIGYPIQKLMLAGIYEIGIVVGDNESELRDGLAHVPTELTYIRQDEPKGLAHAVNCARDFTGDVDFVLLFCDNLFNQPLSYGLAEWLHLQATEPKMSAFIHTVEMPDPRACGVAVVKDGWAVELEEKPVEPKSNLAVIGIDFFTPLIFEAIKRIKPSPRGELEITDAIAELIVMGHKVRARPLTGFWYDTGTFADLIEAQGPVMAEFGFFQVVGKATGSTLNGPVGIVRGAKAMDSTLTGPVLIGRDCNVENCTLGPRVTVGADCKLHNCTLSDCQVYPGTTLSGITDSYAIFDSDLRVGRYSS